MCKKFGIALAVFAVLMVSPIAIYGLRGSVMPPKEKHLADRPWRNHLPSDSELESLAAKLVAGNIQAAAQDVETLALGQQPTTPAFDAAVSDEAIDATEVAAGTPEQADPLPGLLPGERPEWTTQPDDYQSETHRLVVVTLPSTSIEKSREELRQHATRRLQEYASEQLKLSDQVVARIEESAPLVEQLLEAGSEHLVTQEGADGSEPLYQLWGRMDVSPVVRGEMRAWQYESQWTARSFRVVAAMLAALSGMGLVHLALAARVKKTDRSIEQ